MIIIPTDASGTLREYTEIIGLEGVRYTLKLSWNTRTEYWMLSLYTAGSDVIIEGVAVTCGVDLLRGCALGTKPPGLLFAGPTDGDVTRPAIDGLGSRVQLYYRESDDV